MKHANAIIQFSSIFDNIDNLNKLISLNTSNEIFNFLSENSSFIFDLKYTNIKIILNKKPQYYYWGFFIKYNNRKFYIYFFTYNYSKEKYSKSLTIFSVFSDTFLLIFIIYQSK